MTLVAFEALAVTTILPEIEADLGGIAWYGWVTTAFFLGTMIGIVFAGEQADRRGAGPPYLLGLVLFAIGLVIAGLAPSMPVLVVGRFVQGFGAGVVPAIGYVAIGRAFSVEERPRMFAILSTAWVVPGLIGPVLAERITAAVGWRWVFLALLPLVIGAGALVLPAMMRLGPVDRTEHPDEQGAFATPFLRLRLVEAIRVAVGAAIVVGALTADLWLLLPGAIAGAIVGLRPLSRLTPPGTLRGAAGLPAAIASRGVLTFAFFGLDAFIPFALTNGRDRSTLAGSVAVTVVTVSWTVATWIQDRWIVRLGEALFIRVGFGVLASGIVTAAAGALPGLVPFWFIHLGGGLAGFGMGLAYAAHSQLALRSAEEHSVGATTASLQLFDNLGIALGTGVVGAIVTFGDGAGWRSGDATATAWVLSATVALGGVLLASRLPQKLVRPRAAAASLGGDEGE
ncbi:MAG: MFS transporter [Ilumatobacter sp.]|uniref:MFS transporter n=1 Tax=Ilumatobacter sp. TaxID=1967498 RepID=UPI00391AA4EA